MMTRPTPTVVAALFDAPPSWHGKILYLTRAGGQTYGEARRDMLLAGGWLSREHGIGPRRRVCMCLPKGPLAASVMLGTMAAGACYVPLEFNGPFDRQIAILDQAAPHLLVTTPALARRFAASRSGEIHCPVVTVEEGGFPAAKPLVRPVDVDGAAPAVIFFTSGSTGTPKGIVASRRSMAETVARSRAVLSLSDDDRILFHPPLHYSGSITLFEPLYVGCTTFILSDQEALFPDVVAAIIEKLGITVWQGAASFLRALVDGGNLERRELSSVRFFDFFGERLPVPIVERAQRHFPKAHFSNTYGASEAFWMSRYDVPRPLGAMAELPIGKPYDAFKLSLLDAGGHEVEAGEMGEICVEGPVLLDSYWQDPEATRAARLNGNPNSFRTGDLARRDEAGNLVFLGRRDLQVKVRGHRFELEEIEQVLASCPGVTDAVASAIEGGTAAEIRAAVVCGSREGLADRIVSYCAQKLPRFARPARLLFLDALPRLPSGKIDRLAIQRLLV